MYRGKLIDSLLAYTPEDSSEKVFKKQILEFVNEHEDCFERTLEIGHITASCWLLDKTGNRALLTHHTKLNRWFQLGGHCDGDSDVLRVAKKEAREESGIEAIEEVSSDIFDIDVHLIPANKREKAHYHYDIRYLLKVVGDEEIKKSSESKELRWIEKDLSKFPTDLPSVVRMFNKWNALS